MIDHVTVMYTYLWNCHGSCSMLMWRRQELRLFQRVQEWNFDDIGTFRYWCSIL